MLLELGSADKIVVTGGAGFIGGHLVERLLAETDARLTLIDTFMHGSPAVSSLCAEPRVHVVEADVRDMRAVGAAMQGARLVYHLAAQPLARRAATSPTYTFKTNVVGTYSVFRCANQASVQRVIFTSSREVYGEPLLLPVEEDAPLLPISLCGATKVAGEALCRVMARQSGMTAAVLRLTNVYGPRDTQGVIPTWIRRAATGQPLRVYGGHQVVDLVGIKQVIQALIRVASSDERLPPINVGSGTGTSLIQLARRIVRLSGNRSPIAVHPAGGADVKRFVAGIGRMRELLNIEPPLDPLAALACLIPGGIRVHG